MGHWLAKKLAVPVALGLGVPIAPVAGLGAMYGVTEAENGWLARELVARGRVLKRNR